MDLELSAERKHFVETIRRYARSLADQNDSAVEVDGDYGPQASIEDLANLGLTGLTLPEDVAGADASLLDMCLALEELGRSGIGTPLITSTVMAGGVLADVGGPSVRPIVHQIARGQAVATVALLAADSTSEWSWSSATGTRTENGWALSGDYSQVPYADDAAWILLAADLEGRGRSLVLISLREVPRNTVAIRSQRVIGGARRSAVTLTDTPVRREHVLDVASEYVSGLLDDALIRASVLHTAHAVGASEGALDLTVAWAQQRHQFGRPIGSFQTVANRCADIRLAIDPARLLTWEAAWAIDAQRPDRFELASVAKGYLCEAAPSIVINAHQVLAANGYSVEHPLHVYTRLIKAFQSTYGNSAMHLERVASALGL